MKLVALLEIATDRYFKAIAEISRAQWGAPWICADWTLQHENYHAVGGNRFAVTILEGRSLKDWADSTGQRNEFGKFLLRHHIAEGFARSSVKASLNCFEVGSQ